MRKVLALTSIFILLIFVYRGLYGRCPLRQTSPKAQGILSVSIGMSRQQLFKIYPITEERTYRVEGNQEWITFNNTDDKDANGFVTFILKDNKVAGWRLNDRKEVVEEYLSEFSPLVFKSDYPKIYTAITDVLNRIPQDVFLLVTDRSYPVVFSEYHYKGQGRFANSVDVWNLEIDPPTYKKGFYLIKLSTELNNADNLGAIEAVIAHELAHMVLKHGSQSYSLKLDIEANFLVKKWGFEKEFSKAKQSFR